MKLDTTVFRYLDKDAFRVLTAVEMGMKNHQWVPTQLIESIAHLRRGNTFKVLSLLLKHKLVAHNKAKYDGYKLTYNGYDFLALRAFVNKGLIRGVGTRIGVGKESDIHVCEGAEGEKYALKLHRLGRVSFKTIKLNRDYMGHRKSASWMYMARLAAKKEFDYLHALQNAGFRVPEPVELNRHVVLMKFVEARPLYQIRELKNTDKVLERLMRLIVRLARSGLIHGDFNEFNLMIDAKEEITLIDFPQVVTVKHNNAKMYFDRDVRCIRDFFCKRFNVSVETWPEFHEVIGDDDERIVVPGEDLELCDSSTDDEDRGAADDEDDAASRGEEDVASIGGEGVASIEDEDAVSIGEEVSIADGEDAVSLDAEDRAKSLGAEDRDAVSLGNEDRGS